MEYTGGSWKKTTSDQLGLSIMTWEIDGDSDYWVAHVQTEADAKLIAAAPDLLRELKLAVQRLEDEGCEFNSVQFKAVIAKAEGR